MAANKLNTTLTIAETIVLETGTNKLSAEAIKEIIEIVRRENGLNVTEANLIEFSMKFIIEKNALYSRKKANSH